MLKNKKALYVLLPLVLLIWGIIFYRVFSAIAPAEPMPVESFQIGSVLQGAGSSDTFSIKNDYRDPFLAKPVSVSLPAAAKKILKKESIPAPPVVWPVIIYKGMIRNHQTGKQVYLVSVGGQESMMKPGDVLAEAELSRAFRDSIEMVYKKEIKIFKK